MKQPDLFPDAYSVLRYGAADYGRRSSHLTSLRGLQALHVFDGFLSEVKNHGIEDIVTVLHISSPETGDNFRGDRVFAPRSDNIYWLAMVRSSTRRELLPDR